MLQSWNFFNKTVDEYAIIIKNAQHDLYDYTLSLGKMKTIRKTWDRCGKLWKSLMFFGNFATESAYPLAFGVLKFRGVSARTCWSWRQWNAYFHMYVQLYMHKCYRNQKNPLSALNWAFPESKLTHGWFGGILFTVEQYQYVTLWFQFAL
jgi:hypothetical protein